MVGCAVAYELASGARAFGLSIRGTRSWRHRRLGRDPGAATSRATAPLLRLGPCSLALWDDFVHRVRAIRSTGRIRAQRHAARRARRRAGCRCRIWRGVSRPRCAEYAARCSRCVAAGAGSGRSDDDRRCSCPAMATSDLRHSIEALARAATAGVFRSARPAAPKLDAGAGHHRRGRFNRMPWSLRPGAGRLSCSTCRLRCETDSRTTAVTLDDRRPAGTRHLGNPIATWCRGGRDVSSAQRSKTSASTSGRRRRGAEPVEAAVDLMPALGHALFERSAPVCGQDRRRVAGHRAFVDNAPRVSRDRSLSERRAAGAAHGDADCRSGPRRTRAPRARARPAGSAGTVKGSRVLLVARSGGITGLSARQLQWWDARRLFVSAIASHRTEAGGFTERATRRWTYSSAGARRSSPSRLFGPAVRRLLSTLRDVFGVRSTRPLAMAGR